MFYMFYHASCHLSLVFQLYHAMESHLSELAIKPRLAVVFGTGDTEIR